MSILRNWAVRRWYVLAAAVTASLLLGGRLGATPGHALSAAPAGTHFAVAKAGHVAAGRLVHAATSRTPFVPTAAQRAARQRDMKKVAAIPRAPIGPHTTGANVGKLRGPQTSLTTAQAPNSFSVFKNSTMPAECTTSCGQATVNEPDTANAGKYVIQTSNWNIAYATNFGSSPVTWAYQNPYSLSSAFCCDQTVLNVPSRNRFIYAGLTLGTGSQVGFSIAVTASQSPTSWCVYQFSA